MSAISRIGEPLSEFSLSQFFLSKMIEEVLKLAGRQIFILLKLVLNV